MLAQMFLIHALRGGDLLTIPIGVVDAILPVFFGNFLLVPVINVVVGAFAYYYAAALACASIAKRHLKRRAYRGFLGKRFLPDPG